MTVKKLVINFDAGFCVNSGILSGPNADKGGYNVNPPVKNCEKVLIRNVKEITRAKPNITSIQLGSVRRKELRNSLKKYTINVTRKKIGSKI